ncbi:MAG: tetratricopeptide repeat protein [Acidobacteria bacterium]|nr:tetratricopeptide repeat protein [Acidobacteriota bacterium]
MPTKHLTRKELTREDEIHSTLSRIYAFSLVHRLEIILAVVAVMVVGAGIIFYRNYEGKTNAEAQNLFAQSLDALHVHEGQVVVSGGSPDKYRKALEGLQALVNRYPSSDVRPLAQYYLGLTQKGMGKTQDAARVWQSVIDQGDNAEVVQLAQHQLGLWYIEKGESARAVDLYAAIASSGKSNFPKDVALFNLGQAYEGAGKKKEASETYTKLLTDYPDSPLKEEAEMRLNLLLPSRASSKG